MASEIKMGYGLLLFEIFGHPYVEGKYPQIVEDYRRKHPKALFPPNYPTSWNKFLRWCERQLLAQYDLPEQIIQAVDHAIGTLPERYKEVVHARFGLSDGIERTPDEVGEQIKNELTGNKGVTRERIRQIEARAIIKLRAPSVSGKIKASLTDTYLRDLFGFESPEE